MTVRPLEKTLFQSFWTLYQHYHNDFVPLKTKDKMNKGKVFTKSIKWIWKIRFLEGKTRFVQINTVLLGYEVLFEVLGGTLTSSIDGGLLYPLRQSNRYPCNQICYARGAFESQNLLQAKFIQMGLFCSQDTIQLLNLLLHSKRMQRGETHTHGEREGERDLKLFLSVFLIFILSFVSHYTHARSARANFI